MLTTTEIAGFAGAGLQRRAVPQPSPWPAHGQHSHGAGTSGNEPGSWHPAGRSIAESAAPGEHGGHCACTSLSGTRILMRSPPGLAGKRMSRPSAVGQRPRIVGVPRPALGVLPGGIARAYAGERCANAVVHTFGSALDFQRRT
jgi:hypothetical protein